MRSCGKQVLLRSRFRKLCRKSNFLCHAELEADWEDGKRFFCPTPFLPYSIFALLQEKPNRQGVRALACFWRRYRMFQQFYDRSVENLSFFAPQAAKAERLQKDRAALHRKKHLGLGAHHAVAKVDRESDSGSLVDAGIEFQQPSGHGEPAHFGSDLSTVLQLYNGSGVCTRAHSRSALRYTRIGEVSH